MASALTCRIVNPSGVLWEGMAAAVTSTNDAGEFSILSGHTNFISLIIKGVRVKPVGETTNEASLHDISASDGVLICKDDVVEVYLSETGSDTSAAAPRVQQLAPTAPQAADNSKAEEAEESVEEKT